MPHGFREPPRPIPWRQFSAGKKLTKPLFFLEWLSRWAAFLLGQWALLDVLEYMGSLSILVGVIFYFADAKNRLEQKHYQAWQVINTAQGKGGNGGRIDALQNLNDDHIALVGIDVRDAFLQGIRLDHANLRRCNLSGCDMRQASLRQADVDTAALISTNLRGADLSNADFTNSDLHEADLSGANLANAVLESTDLHGVDLSGIVNWQSIASIKSANIFNVANAPDGFLEWARAHNAVAMAADDTTQSSKSQTVSISAAISLKEALTEIARDYHDDTGNTADLNFGASGTLIAQIKQGAPVDLFVSAGTREVDNLVATGLADTTNRRDIARNRLVLIVPKDAKNPPTKFEDLVDDRFVHIAIGEPKVVPAGQYAMETLKSLGLDQKLSPKLVMGENVRQVLSYVMRGEADAGVVYATDAAAAAESVKLAVTADESTHSPIVYPAVIIKSGNHPAAVDFLNYLGGSKAQAVLIAHGFSLPAGSGSRP